MSGASIVNSMAPTDIRENWWDKSNKLDSFANSSVNDIFGANETNRYPLVLFLLNMLARADGSFSRQWFELSACRTNYCHWRSGNFEELINSENAQNKRICGI